jgi:hypothetical protein
MQSSKRSSFSSDHIESTSNSASKIILLEIANVKLSEEVVQHKNDLKYVWNCLATQNNDIESLKSTIANMQAQITLLVGEGDKKITKVGNDSVAQCEKSGGENVSEKAFEKTLVKREHSNESIVEFSD